MNITYLVFNIICFMILKEMNFFKKILTYINKNKLIGMILQFIIFYIVLKFIKDFFKLFPLIEGHSVHSSRPSYHCTIQKYIDEGYGSASQEHRRRSYHINSAPQCDSEMIVQFLDLDSPPELSAHDYNWLVRTGGSRPGTCEDPKTLCCTQQANGISTRTDIKDNDINCCEGVNCSEVTEEDRWAAVYAGYSSKYDMGNSR